MALSNETIENFLHILPAVLYEYVLYEDKSSEFLYMSPAAVNLLEHHAEHFMKDTGNFWSMVHPDDVARLYEDDVSANQENEFFVSEIRIKLPSGKQKWIQMSSKPSDRKKNGCAIWSGFITDISVRKAAEIERDELIQSLKTALEEIKVLQGIIPICSYCHSIRDDSGAWDQMESYLSNHSDVTFSHGICPGCLQKARDEMK